MSFLKLVIKIKIIQHLHNLILNATNQLYQKISLFLIRSEFFLIPD